MPRQRTGSEDRSKREDLAALLPVFGAVLLMPLVANLFLTRTQLFGLPLDMLYLFAVWVLLIAGAIGLSFRLPEIGSSGDDARHQDDGGLPHPGKD